MLKTEAKNKIISTIRDIEDERIIHEIYRLLQIDLEEDVYQTNDAQKKAVDAALSEINEGKTLTEQEVNEQTTEWLNKKK